MENSRNMAAVEAKDTGPLIVFNNRVRTYSEGIASASQRILNICDRLFGLPEDKLEKDSESARPNRTGEYGALDDSLDYLEEHLQLLTNIVEKLENKA
jgi:hypothetical protein